MAALSIISHTTPFTLIYLLITSATITTAAAVNITDILSSFPDLSNFSELLSTTGVASELNDRTSLTLLVLRNSNLEDCKNITGRLSRSSLADLLRYHILLKFISWTDLHQIPPSGDLVNTLGGANTDSASVNLTRDPAAKTLTVSIPSTSGASSTNAAVLSVIKTLPYNITILAVDSFLLPSRIDLTASETSPLLVQNISYRLIMEHDFKVASSMLMASGLENEFELEERGAGLTLFIPTDSAFTDLPDGVKLQSLSADNKSAILKFHVLHSYYALGSLLTIVNPVQPTMATESMGAGSYTLNISPLNGTVIVDTGLVRGSVTRTVFDQNPIVIFGVSKVLLPKEIFGNLSPAESDKSGDVIKIPSPTTILPTRKSPDLEGLPSHLSTTPGSNKGFRSGSDYSGLLSSNIVLGLCCIGLYIY